MGVVYFRKEYIKNDDPGCQIQKCQKSNKCLNSQILGLDGFFKKSRRPEGPQTSGLILPKTESYYSIGPKTHYQSELLPEG